jgi:hypothetical protein
VLMTKFGMARKTGLTSLGNWSIWFCQFQNKITEEVKLEDLKIQECLKHDRRKLRHQGTNPCVDDQI